MEYLVPYFTDVIERTVSLASARTRLNLSSGDRDFRIFFVTTQDL